MQQRPVVVFCVGVGAIFQVVFDFVHVAVDNRLDETLDVLLVVGLGLDFLLYERQVLGELASVRQIALGQRRGQYRVAVLFLVYYQFL